ncbi:uncharacterized protein N7529_004704 [Penicillium soppii]|uniref:uncharacterized protein n=1 Tax=Penicillium soppii TaxID=69789 RepID=UPI0025468FE6|nr:uncharacterized protein N7529_004704 [Penicillium soppii]KAJ5872351.1 hypothetical protein N7529_004704 [Penicillium soppii]
MADVIHILHNNIGMYESSTEQETITCTLQAREQIGCSLWAPDHAPDAGECPPSPTLRRFFDQPSHLRCATTAATPSLSTYNGHMVQRRHDCSTCNHT